MAKYKLVTILTIIYACCVTCHGQTAGSQQNPQQSEEQQIVAMLLADEHAPIYSFVEKSINRLGDGAAVGIMEFLGDRKTRVSEESSSPVEISRILFIIRMAFAAPNAIQSETNKSPKATLILLKYLGCLPTTDAVKDDLSKTINFIEQVKLASLVPNEKK